MKTTNYPGSKVHYAPPAPKNTHEILALFENGLKKSYTFYGIKSLVDSTLLSFLKSHEVDNIDSFVNLFKSIQELLIKKCGQDGAEKVLTESLNFARKYTAEYEYSKQNEYLTTHDILHEDNYESKNLTGETKESEDI